jgi:hypothetical protein
MACFALFATVLLAISALVLFCVLLVLMFCLALDAPFASRRRARSRLHGALMAALAEDLEQRRT